ncbi:hypothetical protein J0895_24335 [Phormidium pseudopriestleyi FRX01]|uniref:Uncharacterized protein n=1 Tax=Phormidium pseudopriestleyi FRX01 TaxID=1759528 RepID=A0ABS3FYL0_9CYAN|nr:hypothetical protein [Phormidium pseudopriestleyi]MBO0352153.1 hypothetical protein [Phormidium pseudopriestleyi FRX01]
MDKQKMDNQENVNKKATEPVKGPVHYDRNIVPAEVAARQEREGDKFMKAPSSADDPNENPDHTRDGFTVDQEGLVNNYAIEPEMYVDEPGDLREKEAALKAERARESYEVHHNDEDGKLTMEGDRRGKGPGMI